MTDNKKIGNISPKEIPLLSWNTEEYKDSIGILYDFVQATYLVAINWYLDRKTKKQLIAKSLRMTALILVIVAGLCLVILTSNTGENWAQWCGTLSTALLVLAAGLVAVDRFFGYSTSWMRFILTALQLQLELNRFQLDFNHLSLERQPCSIDDSCCKEICSNKVMDKKMKRIRESCDYLYLQLQNETQQWVDEFRGRLNQSVNEMLTNIQSNENE